GRSAGNGRPAQADQEIELLAARRRAEPRRTGRQRDDEHARLAAAPATRAHTASVPLVDAGWPGAGASRRKNVNVVSPNLRARHAVSPPTPAPPPLPPPCATPTSSS